MIPQWADIPPRAWPNTARGPTRVWHRAAVVIVVIERIATFAYFIPTMVRLMGTELPGTEVEGVLSQWQRLNHGRHALTLAGWLGALKALSLSR